MCPPLPSSLKAPQSPQKSSEKGADTPPQTGGSKLFSWVGTNTVKAVPVAAPTVSRPPIEQARALNAVLNDSKARLAVLIEIYKELGQDDLDRRASNVNNQLNGLTIGNRVVVTDDFTVMRTQEGLKIFKSEIEDSGQKVMKVNPWDLS